MSTRDKHIVNVSAVESQQLAAAPPRDDFRAKPALAGLTMDDLVSVQVFCPDLTLYETFNRVDATYFTRGFPARAFIGSGRLLRGCRFEITGIAARR